MPVANRNLAVDFCAFVAFWRALAIAVNNTHYRDYDVDKAFDWITECGVKILRKAEQETSKVDTTDYDIHWSARLESIRHSLAVEMNDARGRDDTVQELILGQMQRIITQLTCKQHVLIDQFDVDNIAKSLILGDLLRGAEKAIRFWGADWHVLRASHLQHIRATKHKIRTIARKLSPVLERPFATVRDLTEAVGLCSDTSEAKYVLSCVPCPKSAYQLVDELAVRIVEAERPPWIRKLSGLGIYLQVPAGECAIKICWTHDDDLDETGKSRGVQDYLLFVTALNHEMFHLVAPLKETVATNTRNHGWMSYVLCLDQRELAARRRGPFENMRKVVMDDMLSRGPVQVKELFNPSDKPRIGWLRARKVHELLERAFESKSADEPVLWCAFSSFNGRLTPFSIMYVAMKCLWRGNACACGSYPKRAVFDKELCAPVSEVFQWARIDIRSLLARTGQKRLPTRP